MRKVVISAGATLIALALSACGSGGGGLNRARPDEFAVQRQAPLVIPPDFALTPPKPGAPRPQEADSSTQALEAMFGGAAQRSASEAAAINQAGGARAEPGIRSEAGDPATTTVNKGSTTRDIIAAPEGDGEDARVSTPQ
ncbi:DUF3035 domain-containing protein [Sphingomonas sanxanigenens]|uniref:DUF3035 domain-containing protein n=1 Tax=Sphingomonas sanxanigenens DSM 19645 = NX02 TaxID=1123269 RepID=W0AK41_9SPHN|nr:DUF3035 domain-containing protein [Sphingomonas sanxanigenens]AHE56937.1 hypothetical protein NX02_26730 [Sphingomonas sanxanigenens DSM 19645 = NX02]